MKHFKRKKKLTAHNNKSLLSADEDKAKENDIDPTYDFVRFTLK